jgi:hypothetical protein
MDLAALIGLFALWRGTAILNACQAYCGDVSLIADAPTVAEVRALSVLLLALVVLEGSVCFASGFAAFSLLRFLWSWTCWLSLLVQGHLWGEEAGRVKFLRLAVWWCCNLYYVSFMFLPVAPLKQWYALLFVAVFAFFFFKIPGMTCSKKRQM